LIVEHCYIERRLRPLNLFLREADPAAAESAIIDYGNAPARSDRKQCVSRRPLAEKTSA